MIGIKSIWTDKEILFLKQNFFKLTNAQLAKSLGKTITVTRHKCYELGLKKIVMEYWTNEQVEFLKEHFQTIGDVELAEMFQDKFPKLKKWTRNHIDKKRNYLNLQRTEQEILNIRRRNYYSGRTNTIGENSGSKNLPDTIIVSYLAGKNKPHLKSIFLEMPELIELKRNQIKLNRLICKTNKQESKD